MLGDQVELQCHRYAVRNSSYPVALIYIKKSFKSFHPTPGTSALPNMMFSRLLNYSKAQLNVNIPLCSKKQHSKCIHNYHIAQSGIKRLN